MKDKKIIALLCGITLAVIAIILFFTLQAKDRMVEDTEVRLKPIAVTPQKDEKEPGSLGDTYEWSCTDWIETHSVEVPQNAGGGFGSCVSYNSSQTTCGKKYGTGVCANASGQMCDFYVLKARTCNQVLTGCDSGEYLTGDLNDPNRKCEPCPEGYRAGEGNIVGENNCVANVMPGWYVASAGEEPTYCAAGTYSAAAHNVKWGEVSPANTCQLCSPGTVSGKASTKCTECPNGYYSNKQGLDVCVRCPVERPYTNMEGATSIDNCVANKQNCDPGTYVKDGTCAPCDKGYICKGGQNVPMKCGEGEYQDETGQSKCKGCPTGTTSAAGSVSLSSCMKYEDFAVGCSISASTDSKHTSIGDTYTVTVSVSGDGCVGKTLNYSAYNGNVSKTSDTITSGNSSYTFDVTPTTECDVSHGIANLVYLSQVQRTANTSDVQTRPQWSSNQACANEATATYKSAREADVAGSDVYYSGYDIDKKCYTVQHTRGCGGGGGTTPGDEHCYANNKDIELATAANWQSGATDAYPYLISNISNYSLCKARACYKNSDGTDYIWRTNDNVPTGYTKVSRIKEKDICINEHCYIDTNNEYHWGFYGDKTGYTIVSSIDDKNACENPTSTDYACYVKDNDYVWRDTQPEGYTKVDGVTSAKACKKEGCYITPTGEYEWGKFDDPGYTLIGSVEEEKYCKKPNEACYVLRSDASKYVWGDYSLDNDYILIPDMDSTECGVVPVPPTGLSTQTIIYIAMIIMFGTGVFLLTRYYIKKPINR